MPKLMEEKKSKDKSKTESSFTLFPILLIVIFLVIGYFLVFPGYGRLSDIRAKIISQKQMLEDKTKAFRDTNKLLENYAAIPDEDRAKINTMLPRTIDEPGIFTLFEFLAEKNKMAVLALDISEKEAAADLKNLGLMEDQVALNLAASPASTDLYGDFKKFFSSLEANLRLMDIISVNYSPESSSYILNIKTYRLESAVSAGSTQSAAL